VLPTCASHRERSRLDAASVVLAQGRYQVGFASLEPILGVGGELSGEVGVSSLAERRCSWSGFFCVGSLGRPVGGALPNRAFLPTVGWTSAASWGGGGPHRERPG
jgi:hypothetical protein